MNNFLTQTELGHGIGYQKLTVVPVALFSHCYVQALCFSLAIHAYINVIRFVKDILKLRHTFHQYF